MQMNRRHFIASTAALGAAATTGAAHAQPKFPDHPITLVEPFTPGGSTDYFSRALAEEMSRLLGQPIVVENKAGSGGALAAEFVAKAKPDGYTLGMASVSTHVANPAVNKALRYDPVKDFAPITSIVSLPSATVVLNSSPFKSLHDLIKAAKAKPGTVSFASPGVGSAGHVLLEQFAHLAGVKFLHVPFRGGSRSLTDLLGGQIDVSSDNIPTLLPHIKSGALRVLALRDTKRLPQLPDVPTFKELGFEPVSHPLWFGLVAPAGTPPELIKRLNEVAHQAMRTPAFQQKIETVAGTYAPSTPEQFQRLIQQWLAQFKQAVQVANITIE